MITLEEAPNIPLPPAPKTLKDVLPPVVPATLLFNDLDIKDVIANPLYAYMKETERRWVNFDRRDMRLQVKAQWVSVAAGKVLPGVEYTRNETIREGISSSTTMAEMFAASVGVMTGVSTPVVDLGASISTTLTQSTSQTFTISSEKTTSTTFTITSPRESIVWLWQLNREFLLSGNLTTWAVTGDKGIDQLTGNDSEPVLTRDGEGRQRTNMKQVSGAKPETTRRFAQSLPVDSDVFVFTAFPSPDGVSAQMGPADNSGSKIAIRDFATVMAEFAGVPASEEAA